MRSFIVGSAGHIDHGKTALVRALTGIDTDRLKEEKARGITIELGFAHLQLGDLAFGIVDVPGHERFIKSMVAGAGGIDLVILVIAADEGVMPQTREHLDICRLLGVRRGLVALTKVDLVDAEWLDLISEEIRELVGDTFLAEAPILPCSAVRGDGLDAVRGALCAAVADLPQRDCGGLLRMPLDRVFTLKGFGTVVTGTLLGGRIRRGDEVAVLPSEVLAPVRRVQVHGQDVEQAVAGQRTAINLGGIERQAIARGEVVAQPGTLTPSKVIDVRLRLLPAAPRGLKARFRVLFHLGTRQQETTCVLLGASEVAPGAEALAQLRFDRPVVALPADRFILRGFVKQENYGTTIGGGEVIRVLAAKIKPKDARGRELLERMARAAPRERVALEVLSAGPRGLRTVDLQRRLPLSPEALRAELAALRSAGELLCFEEESGAVVHAEHAEALRRTMLAVVDRFHQESPLRPGISRAELRSRLPVIDPRLFSALLQQLAERRELVVDQEFCLRPDHRDRVGAALAPAIERIAEHLDSSGLGPPREVDLPQAVGLPAEQVRAALKALLDDDRAVRVGQLLFARHHLDDLEQRLRAMLVERGAITPGDFKDLVGKSRKYAIPLAEHFDAQRVTVRDGDLRRLAGSVKKRSGRL